MKKLILGTGILCTLVLPSCSHEKFAFRKKIRVENQQEALVTHNTKEPVKIDSKGFQTISEGSNTLAVPELNSSSQARVLEKSQPSKETIEASVDKSNPVVITPQWKQQEPIEQTSPKTPNRTQEGGDGKAIAGFILALVGLLILPIVFSTLGIIFSALGLKSNRKGLAIAGLIIGIAGLLFSVIYVGMNA